MYRLAALIIGLALAACAPDDAGLLAASALDLAECRKASAAREDKLVALAETSERIRAENVGLEAEVERSRAKIDGLQALVVRQRAQLEAALKVANESPK